MKLYEMIVMCYCLTWDASTARERISLISDQTGADGVVVGHPALSIDATEARTGVLAALLHTGRALTAL